MPLDFYRNHRYFEGVYSIYIYVYIYICACVYILGFFSCHSIFIEILISFEGEGKKRLKNSSPVVVDDC